ncbi:NAD kinase [uncultured Flavobacterium sp.]|uniref:NAD kinase n=1 Tax=uncultured Flavobacterium sp. TaxID=165435 RepID=UPI0030EB5FA1|tara:strand:+ start:74109 stop:74993 length:885 start_codon:yes stop_codon:yes gene_type:complete
MKIALFGKNYQNNTIEIIRKVIDVLEKKGAEICIEKKFFESIKDEIKFSKEYEIYKKHDELNESIDFLISIGGDGTILRAATLVRDKKIPIVGVNAGRLGFLATVQEENIETFLPKLFLNEFKISKRTLLSLKCSPPNKDLEDINFALNEVTVSRKDTTSMITIETFLNDEYLNSYWADGLIIATPTGSTGYSLSCGGPVLMPENSSLVITPIAPHNLTARPLVIPDDIEIKLSISGREEQFLVSLDSRITTVTKETHLTIKKAPFEINMVEFSEEGFLKTIRKKLLWGEDKRN